MNVNRSGTYIHSLAPIRLSGNAKAQYIFVPRSKALSSCLKRKTWWECQTGVWGSLPPPHGIQPCPAMDELRPPHSDDLGRVEASPCDDVMAAAPPKSARETSVGYGALAAVGRPMQLGKPTLSHTRSLHGSRSTTKRPSECQGCMIKTDLKNKINKTI